MIRPDQFFIRGFEANSQAFRKDGYLDPTYVPRDVANIERIDVLKGPNSVLFGASQPTGTFNVITKKPMLDPYLWGGVTFGSFGLQRYAFDANMRHHRGQVRIDSHQRRLSEQRQLSANGLPGTRVPRTGRQLGHG